MMSEIHKILIIRLSSIGDILLTTPLIRALRQKYPQAAIDFIVKEQYVDLLKTNPRVSNVITFDHKAGIKELRTLKKHIKKERYDLLVDIHKNFRSVYLRTGAGAGSVVKYRKDYVKRFLLIRFGIKRFTTVMPTYKRYFRAVESLGIAPDNRGTELHIPGFTFKQAHSVLVKNGLRDNQPLIVLCPGAGFATKRWHVEGFAAVGDYFARNHGAMIIILGSQYDEDACEAVQKRMMELSVNFAGKFSLLEDAAVMQHSSLVVTNDTGLMHIAQTQKKPVVAIFGCTSRELGYFPFPENSFVIEKNLKCRPCTHNGKNKCPEKHFRCMLDITSDEVIEAAEQLFSSEVQISSNNHGKNLVSSI